MTTIDFNASTRPSASHSAFVTRATNWASNALRAWKNRRAFYHLGEMSDVELHDIGLTRGDLAVPLDLPFTYDPTEHLGRTARQRIMRMETYARYVA